MNELTDESPMPFGKYKGAQMSDVPAGYLHWLWTQAGYSRFGVARGPQGAVANYIKRNLDVLKQEYQDGIWD